MVLMGQIMNKKKWIGFDLDGTIAETINGDGIGLPIKPMIDLLLKIHQEKKYEVKIFTARAESPEKVVKIRDWLDFYGLPKLDITNVKDSFCALIIDNIAMRVYKDRGVICQSCLSNVMSEISFGFVNNQKKSTMELL
jgi:hypothetical protein